MREMLENDKKLKEEKNDSEKKRGNGKPAGDQSRGGERGCEVARERHLCLSLHLNKTKLYLTI